MQITGEHTFVLEIGSEELPPQDVSSAIAQACKKAKPLFIIGYSDACDL